MAKPSRSRRGTMRPRFDHLEAKRLMAVTIFNVTDPGDAATGQTLRAAILAANAGPGTFDITFTLPGATTTIQPATPLPTITAAGLMIDGSTQPGSTNSPAVTIDGTGAGGGANGLSIAAAGVQVIDLSIGHFSGAGVAISGPGGDTVTRSFLGVDTTGAAAIPNGQGVLINNAPGNVIGGLSAPAANLISGNTGAGVAITGALAKANLIGFDRIGVATTSGTSLANGVGVSESGGSSNVVANSVVSGNAGGGISFLSGKNNVVQSTFVGTDTTGEIKVGNGHFGIAVNGESGDQIGVPGLANLNIVSNSGGFGIDVTGSQATIVANTFVGLDRAGIAPMGNVLDGVMIENTSTGTTVGGSASGAGNFIAANTVNGVDVATGSTGTLIQGNDIGTDVSGMVGIPNGQNGVQLNQTAATIKFNSVLDNSQSGILLFGGSGSVVQSNFIGDVASGTHGNAVNGVFVFGSNNNLIGGAGAGNIISSNADFGVAIESGSQNNVVAGNFVGLSAGGQGTRGNANGIAVFDSTGTTIGGLSAAAVNIIGGNHAFGVDVDGTGKTGTAGTAGTLIAGNMIGVATTGTTAAANATGVILAGATGVMVQQNIISGNTVDGVFVSGGSGSTIKTNLIGTDVSGLRQLGNGGDGVDIQGASHITVGGTAGGDTNVISANSDNGVEIGGAGASANTIVGDWIGVDHSGLSALGNGLSGIFINNVPGTTIGGSAAAFNVIGFNSDEGIAISGPLAGGTTVVANFVGLGIDGVTSAGNGIDGVLVQQAVGVNVSFNVISENTAYGVHIASGASNAVISGDLLGTDVTGTIARGNGLSGVLLDGTSGAVVGGSAAARDVISANGKSGVFIFGATARGNLVAGDFIGVNAQGTGALGNGGDGIMIQAPSNVIGGLTTATTNVISGNASAGIHILGGGTGNVIAGNWVGTDATGLRSLGNNFFGIYVDGTTGTGSASGNLIGGSAAGSKNVIVGSGVVNLNIAGPTANGTVVQGNAIGTNVTGSLGLFPTPFGIAINGTAGTIVGGTTAGSGNTISGSISAGINIVNAGSSGNLVVGNVIGKGGNSSPTLANNVGVLITNAPNNTVGGAASGASNTITGNTVNAIQVVGSGATGNQTSGNVIGPDA